MKQLEGAVELHSSSSHLNERMGLPMVLWIFLFLFHIYKYSACSKSVWHAVVSSNQSSGLKLEMGCTVELGLAQDFQLL